MSKMISKLVKEEMKQWHVIVVGAGPVGLTMAISLAKRNIPVLLVDKKDQICKGSRAICFSNKTLEIFQQLDVAEKIFKKGERWHLSHTMFRNKKVATISFQTNKQQRLPSYINLQQYWLETYLRESLGKFKNLISLWKCEAVDIKQKREKIILTLKIDNVSHKIRTKYLIAADGVNSTIRQLLNLKFVGKSFEEKFLIVDVKFHSEKPNERVFWFDPDFNREKTVLMLKQPDNIWRIDFQLGQDADPEREKQPDKIAQRIRAMLGSNTNFEIIWSSVYTFQSRRLKNFRQKNVFFIGDAAHQFSPFGARGANSGIQDADNLAWKLALVIKDRADDSLLNSYSNERASAADENIRHTFRSLNFISPRTMISKTFRNSVLNLANKCEFARSWINSGRLSTPMNYFYSKLTTTKDKTIVTSQPLTAGASCVDVKLYRQGEENWLLDQVGDNFTLLCYQPNIEDQAIINQIKKEIDNYLLKIILIGKKFNHSSLLSAFDAVEDIFLDQYCPKQGSVYLIRPDKHIAAIWDRLNLNKIIFALKKFNLKGIKHES